MSRVRSPLRRWLLLAAWGLSACGGAAAEPTTQPGPSAVAATVEVSTEAPAAASSTAAPLVPAANASYLPLIDGARYTYAWSYEGQHHEDVLVTQRAAPGAKTFYFVEQAKLDAESVIIGTKMPGGGVYEERDGEVFTGVAFWKRDVAMAHADALFIPKAPAVDQRIQVPNDDHAVELVFRGTRPITVPAGTYPDALWADFKAEGVRGEVVFARGVGLVRWKRHTGRVDELVKVELAR
jgi:hypothetical protein